MRDRERQRLRQREKQASCRKPDAKLDPRTSTPPMGLELTIPRSRVVCSTDRARQVTLILWVLNGRSRGAWGLSG